MNIKLFENSKLNSSNLIDFFSQNHYLNSLNSTDFLEINGKNLSETSFTENFNDIEDLENYDYAEIQNFPFFKTKEKLYFFVSVKKFNSQNSAELEFTIDSISSFGIENLNNIQLFRSHSNFSEFIIAQSQINNFLLKEQPLQGNPEFKVSGKSINDSKFEKITENSKNEFWLIMKAKPELQLESTQTQKILIKPQNIIPNENLALIGWEQQLIIAPMQPTNIIIGTEKKLIWGTNILDKLTNNNLITDYIILDFNPSTLLSWSNEENAIRWEENGTFKYFEDAGNKKTYLIVVDFLSDTLEALFEFNEFKYTSHSSVSNIWLPENEFIMNYSPFKKFYFGFKNEDNSSKNLITYNNLINEKIRISRNFSTNFYSFELTDKIISNTHNFQIPFSTKRDLLGPLSNQDWTIRQNQKELNNINEIILPAVSLLAPGIGIPASILFGAKSIINRQKLKNSPTAISNIGFDLITELRNGYNSHFLTIEELIDSDFYTTAFDFHKFGLFKFDNFYDLKNEINKKQRFNFIKISEYNNPEFYLKFYPNKKITLLIFEALKKGIHFWNFSEENKSFIFDFTNQNPDNNSNPNMITNKKNSL